LAREEVWRSGIVVSFSAWLFLPARVICSNRGALHTRREAFLHKEKGLLDIEQSQSI
jgi:hypothetical protein